MKLEGDFPMDIIRTEILPGVSLSCLKTDKFKNGCLSLTLDRKSVV